MTSEPGSQPSMPDRFSNQSYEDLVSAGLHAPFAGWNLDYLNTRVRECVLPWSYEDLARTGIAKASKVLDLNTGGGELLATLLQGLRSVVVATESWPPNVPVARRLLEPLGVELRQHERILPSRRRRRIRVGPEPARRS